MEKFIESLAELFEAFPSATVTVTYSDKSKSKKASSIQAPVHVVKFKCTEPQLGKSIQYSTRKAKELSRLLTYFGPRGVSAAKRKADADTTEEPTKKPKTEIVGVASVMSNSKFEEPQAEAEEKVAEPTAVAEEKEKTPQPLAKSKKKKKGKKK